MLILVVTGSLLAPAIAEEESCSQQQRRRRPRLDAGCSRRTAPVTRLLPADLLLVMITRPYRQATDSFVLGTRSLIGGWSITNQELCSIFQCGTPTNAHVFFSLKLRLHASH